MVKGAQERRVEDDAAGSAEDPDLILQTAEVDARLAAHGGIDHGEQRRGDVDVVEAALEGGGGKAAKVCHHAAAEVHHQRVACGTALLQAGPHVAQRVKRLVLVGGPDGDNLCAAQAVEARNDRQAEPFRRFIYQYKGVVAFTFTDRRGHCRLQFS